MSIVKMQKVAVFGLDACKDDLMTELMNLEAVELTDQTAKLTEEDWAGKVVLDDGSEEAAKYEAEINKAAQALEVIEEYGKLKGGISLLKSRRSVDAGKVGFIREQNANAQANIDMMLGINENIRKTNERINKIDTDTLMLEPWVQLDVPLNETGTLTTEMILGLLPPAASYEEVEKEVARSTGLAIIKKVSEYEGIKYIAILSERTGSGGVQDILKKSGFSQLNFSDFSGTASEILSRNKTEREKLVIELENLKNEVAAHAPDVKEGIENYSDLQTIEAGKQKVKSKILKTNRTFFIEGWVPEPRTGEVKNVFERYGCHYEFSEPEADEIAADKVPVLLHNPKFFTPVEQVTEMYSLPKYGTFDPTSIYALFYVCFFGMMFSDGCYGLIMAIACGIALKTCHLEGKMYKFVKGFFYCGISTVVWGALFGGWFGDLVAVVGKTFFGAPEDFAGIPPLWINPVEDPLTVLIFSLGLGVVHIFLSMAIKCYIQIKDGHWFDALCDQGFWYMVIVGAILWVGGPMAGLGDVASKVGMWVTIVGAAGLLFLGGRHKKGFGKVTGGLLEIYNITSYMSDILSYARILALGLATGVIAQVVNTIGGLAGGGIKGAIIFIIVFIIGTVINFLINVLGAFVHSARLQFIEFFSRFYEDGGEAFAPFKRETQYIRIDDAANASK